MRNPTPLIITVVALAAMAFIGHHEYYKHTEPPHGWRVLKDAKGRFFLENSNLGCVILHKSETLVSSSRQSAINLAWRLSEPGKATPQIEPEPPVEDVSKEGN